MFEQAYTAQRTRVFVTKVLGNAVGVKEVTTREFAGVLALAKVVMAYHTLQVLLSLSFPGAHDAHPQGKNLVFRQPGRRVGVWHLKRFMKNVVEEFFFFYLSRFYPRQRRTESCDK